MPVRVLTDDGRAVGAVGFDTRTGEFVTVAAGAVMLATGACGRLGLPASGYLYGTYENPTNAGDGYAMAYHAGAELSGIECFQINPLIKDYNGPACAYVANPFGGYQVNSEGDRFVDCDYWSGPDDGRGRSARSTPRAARSTSSSSTCRTRRSTTLEGILHPTERPTRGTFHAGRGHDYRTHDVEMHISEIGLCGGHSASGVWVDENGADHGPGLYAAGDLACVPHNYMIGAFVFGDLAGTHAAAHQAGPGDAARGPDHGRARADLRPAAAAGRAAAAAGRVQAAAVRQRLPGAAEDRARSWRSADGVVHTGWRASSTSMGARNPHELMRCVEVSFIRDCAEMAARASLVRTESRWGLYHERADHPAA